MKNDNKLALYTSVKEKHDKNMYMNVNFKQYL